MNSKEILKAINTCAEEPICFLGSIQPHGYLFILDSNRRVTHISKNVEQILEKKASEIMGSHFEDYFHIPLGFSETTTNTESQNDRFTGVNPFIIEKRGSQQKFITQAHFREDRIYFSLEPQSDGLSDNELLNNVPNGLDLSRNLMVSLYKYHDIDNILTESIEFIYNLTGYGRIKVYRFDNDWNGQVIAELINEDMPSYLGLNFPSSDIPQQARDLYTKNWIRMIPNVDYGLVSIIGNKPTNLDLSFVPLRSVSPVHIQYLKNMDVKASMSLSIIINDKLWGLIAMHHPVPRYVSPGRRVICEFIAQILSLHLAEVQRSNDKLLERAKQNEIDAIDQRLYGGTDVFKGINDIKERIRNLLNADGLWILWDRKECYSGTLPKQKEKLLNFVKEHFNNSQQPLSTHRSKDSIERCSKDFLSTASGIYAILISARRNIYFIWVRKERIKNISWAGAPKKNIIYNDHKARLLPRASFKLFKENISNESLVWSQSDKRLANELKSVLLTSLVLQDDHIREQKKLLEKQVIESTKELERSNNDLSAFSYSVSHDLKAPLRAINGFSNMILEDYAETLDENARQHLHIIIKNASKMGNLINDILAYSRVSRNKHKTRLVDLNMRELFIEILTENIHELKDRDVQYYIGPLKNIKGDQVQVRQLIGNIISNSIKYTKPVKTAKIEVVGLEMDGNYVYKVTDNGVGFDMAYVDKVFLIFERLHLTSEFEGTGVGLAIVKRIVEQNHGKVWIESEPEKGTSIYFTLNSNN